MKSRNSRIAGIAMLVLAALSIINSLSTLLYRNTFWPFFAILGAFLAFLGYVHLKVPVSSSNKFIKISLWIVHGISAALIVSFVIIEVLIINFGSQKDSDTPDYVVILGAGLLGDTPSLTLSQRLDASVELLKKLPEDVPVIVSGGQGPGETITEAEAMKKYLVANGISADRIFEEDKSTNTSENMLFTMDLIKQTDPDKDIKITIVTSNFHMFRSESLAKKAGFSEVQCWSAPIHPLLVPTYYIREYMAVVKSALFD